ncbi:C1 family peptidase [Phaeodactylibacter sp.]|jgi:bleomycin hydrolase|uniref:aminopeptidase C n=1 Tax=Phaeodactylibacter sp. TaxID=1940289 RepID=UPI0025D446D1|nr:C1 family peptidase [Phaeodactylibacter sp.]MCI4650171.1 C1 family peptidase [Phaeodactylibacter sp.]MCI5093279.1 C1 family peptidase [Phaeodactylibacter sp.]
MKLNPILIILFAFLLALPAGAQVDLINKVKNNQSENAKAGFQWTPVVDLERTSVKNQGASGTCWSYSSNSFLESEMIRMGKEPVDLAEMFTVRNTYEEKADRYVRLHGNLNFGQGGALPDVIDMYGKYGAVPQSAYAGLNYGYDYNRHGEMEAILKGMLDAVIANKNKRLSPAWKEAYNKVLDVYLGEHPESFEYMGKTYTPKSFAKEVVGVEANDYVQVTSWTHHPLYEKCVILVPDNWTYGESYNVAMEDMITIIDHALENGYSISWAADVSEKYFSWKNGIAFVPEQDYADMSAEEREQLFNGPKPEAAITVEMRQEAYDNYTTTDDHGMQIVGISKDQNGKEWYLVKNSWGTGNDYEGYLYVSKNYVRFKTLSFLLHKEGIPASLRKKLSM